MNIKGKRIRICHSKPSGNKITLSQYSLSYRWFRKGEKFGAGSATEYSGNDCTGKAFPDNEDCVRVMTPREWGKLQGFINYAFWKRDR